MSEHAFLSVICRDDTKLNKCAVLWIGTLNEGPVQREFRPVLVKEPYSSFT